MIVFWQASFLWGKIGAKWGITFYYPYNQKDPQTLDFTRVRGSLGIPTDIKKCRRWAFEKINRFLVNKRPVVLGTNG